MSGLEREFGGRVTFIRLNILNPDHTEMLKEYGFSTTPELYLVNEEGQIIGFWDEITDVEELREAILKALGEG